MGIAGATGHRGHKWQAIVAELVRVGGGEVDAGDIRNREWRRTNFSKRWLAVSHTVHQHKRDRGRVRENQGGGSHTDKQRPADNYSLLPDAGSFG
jgi:hypothetical protein